MDHALVTGQDRHAFYPMLKGSVNLYLKLLQDGADGKLHLPPMHSPEYSQTPVPDNNYIEGSPVIECSLVAGRALQDMLIQSWGDRIRIFPAVPAEWKEAVFHDLRAEGAFLVSAARRNGTTRWVRIRSLAGEPCRVRPGFAGAFSAAPPSARLRETEPGVFDIALGRDENVILYQEAGDVLPGVAPCALPAGATNVFGVKLPPPVPIGAALPAGEGAGVPAEHPGRKRSPHHRGVSPPRSRRAAAIPSRAIRSANCAAPSTSGATCPAT